MKFEIQPFNRNISDELLLADLVSANEKLRAAGTYLTFRAYRDVGSYAPSTINDRFGTWKNALQKAGLLPHEEKNVSIESLFDNLKVVWIAKGKQPVYRDMNVFPSQYTASTYNARFGGWRKALEHFVATVEGEQIEFQHTPIKIKADIATPQTKRDPSLALRFFALKRDNFRCIACGRSPATVAGLILEVDHVLAWANGGRTVAENLQTLCFDCNRGNGTT
jgi:hypothetical protein